MIGAGMFTRLIRQDCPEDPKRLAVVVAVYSLAAGFLAIALGCMVQIIWHNTLGAGVTAALIATAGPLGAMVYGVHRKPDDPISPVGVEAPPAPGAGVAAELTPSADGGTHA